MNAISPWALSASTDLVDNPPTIFEKKSGHFHFKVISTSDFIWIPTGLPNRGTVAFRAVYSPGADLKITSSNLSSQQGITLELSSAIARQKLSISSIYRSDLTYKLSET